MKAPLHHKKDKKTRRSGAFIASPVNVHPFSPQHDDTTKDDAFYDRDDDDTEYTQSDCLFLWDEESALLDALIDKPKRELGDDPAVLALSESLRDAFVSRGQASKSELAHIFVSTHTEVKDCFKLLDDKLEPTIGKEIIKFNTASKHAERKCLRIAELIEKVEAHNAECNRLEEQIEANFSERDALYARFEEFAEKTLNPVLERLNNLPARNERRMTQMFDDLKALDKKYIAALRGVQSYLGRG